MTIQSGVGLRIFKDFDRPSPSLIAKFKGIPSSNINDEMNRLFCMRHNIKPLNQRPLLGPAFTVKVPMGDNLLLTNAMDLAKPGDIIVVDGEGCEERALMGEMMLTFFEKRGIAGFVIDGAVRDSEAMRQAKVPMYCAAISPQGPFKYGSGEINTPISCGGQVVFPGDILVGDADGVVVIHKEIAEDILQACIDKHDGEVATLADRDRAAKSGDLFSKHKAKYDKKFEAVGGKWFDKMK
ncbi:RraA family protein [Lacticaseibacillus paracasei]|uniref:Putative 4-hydroxy-4-methyl-2-oxoglutarate aldolase n=2 Tax=Lacticaseibacillus paracasei TaxID=1597 RepID=A0A0C9NYJ5_LACPA|nr:RraA family protein [Lacticaseibacillus paracasei]MDB1563677.1 RraA family protein [Lacticaseibacillus paracasei]MXI84804.1 RraA family protein [Lacticaseibacillus paracasei]GAN37100.1 hypothetical protein LC0644_1689 [Lacticaseibacillus paracasei NRIC 0644]GAN40404.1 hypothetical protein LC1917_2281 [Lacticaseibacillus paracasei NRIC 1917]